jgi:nitroreductase
VAVVCGKKKDELSRIIFELAEAKAATNSDIPHPPSWPPDLAQRSGEHGARRLATIGVARDDEVGREDLRLSNFKFYGAPCVVFLLMDSTLAEWSIYDIGAFAQSLILAAHSFGVGSCLQASITNYPDAIRDCLGLPATKKIVIGISMGYPDPDAVINTYQSTRLALDDFVHWYE